MKKIFLTMLLAALLVSCDELLDPLADDDTLLEGDGTPLKENQFYAVNFKKNTFYKVSAAIMAEGEKCVIWAEDGSGITRDKAVEIAAKYDDLIRPKIVGAFGNGQCSAKEDDGKTIQFEDILDYANWLADKTDRKLTILLLDIKDKFNGTTNFAYTAGYFYSGNFYEKGPIGASNGSITGYSNACDMIYVDTNPGLNPNYKLEQQTYATFAHELQHLINFATTVLVNRKNSKGSLSVMDTWIDEGLSSQAEHIYYEGASFDEKEKIFDGNIKEHLDWFIKDKKGTIAKGNNFFVWGNNSDAILDEYSTVYLFFRWLYLQADNELRSSIFLDIEKSDLSDHRVITNVAKKINYEWEDWDKLLRSWLAANYYPTNSVYGYKDGYFKNITVKPLTTKSTPLYPGEGVYSRITGSFSTPSPSGNISYAGLPGSTSAIVTQGSINSGVLLTYNSNSNNKAAMETGSLTGVPASVSSASNSRMITEDEHTGPYRIDARDMSEILGRNK